MRTEKLWTFSTSKTAKLWKIGVNLTMSKQALIVKLVPRYQQLRDERTYSEQQVKNILFAFARDLGCKWSEARLRSFIESAFDFD